MFGDDVLDFFAPPGASDFNQPFDDDGDDGEEEETKERKQTPDKKRKRTKKNKKSRENEELEEEDEEERRNSDEEDAELEYELLVNQKRSKRFQRGRRALYEDRYSASEGDDSDEGGLDSETTRKRKRGRRSSGRMVSKENVIKMIKERKRLKAQSPKKQNAAEDGFNDSVEAVDLDAEKDHEDGTDQKTPSEVDQPASSFTDADLMNLPGFSESMSALRKTKALLQQSEKLKDSAEFVEDDPLDVETEFGDDDDDIEIETVKGDDVSATASKGQKITIVVRQQTGKELEIAMLDTDKLEKLYRGVAKAMQLPREDIVLRFDGLPVQPGQTLKDLDAEDNDMFDLEIKKS